MGQYETMIELGIAVYRVDEVYDTDQRGEPIPLAEQKKWCVSVLSDSPLAATVGHIPLSDTESEAWQRAARHYAAEISAAPKISTGSLTTPNVQTETLFLLDRNVVSVIKEANAGNPQKGPKQQDMLERLREIDLPQNAISPLLSLIEGEVAREANPSEMLAGLNKETRALATFFHLASTDSAFLRNAAYTFVHVFTGLREAKEDERAQLLLQGSRLVVEVVAPARRREIEKKLCEMADALQLERGDPALILLVARLYGSNAARKVVKPNELVRPNGADKVRNVLADIHLVAFIGTIRAVARQLQISVGIEFLTLDEGLDHVLRSIDIDDSTVIHDGGSSMKLRYLPPLFPELPEEDAIALVARITCTLPKG